MQLSFAFRSNRAGGLFTGSIKSSIGIGQLLMEGIGDTIRVSLSQIQWMK